MSFKITYSIQNEDLTELHLQFETALTQVRKHLGEEMPSWIGGKPFRSGNFLEDRNPSKVSELLGKFHTVSTENLNQILDHATRSQKTWGFTPWQDRVAIIRKAAELISERRLEISAIMCLETGKNRLESLGDVEEAADLFRYYASQLEDHAGYVRPLSRLSPNENTRSVLRPFGVFAVISPFNFPLALASGMSGAALLGGNSVVLKPSSETPWCAHKLYECLRDAGLPPGVLQVIYGGGHSIGSALVKHPHVSGLVFTGSKDIGMQLMHGISVNYPKPALLEMGGKNAAIICEKANIENAAEGCSRSAFGLTGQKCSALSRIYVHRSVKHEFLEKLVTKSKNLKIGDPTLRDTFVGPLINEKARNRHMSALTEAKRDGNLLLGSEDLHFKTDFAGGHFVAPVVVELPRHHRLFQDELFSPFLTVDTFDTLSEAIEEGNRSEYGLTAGIFSESKEDVEYFMDNMEAGVLYSNRKTGATTGAWPGVQSFCGWKGSGSTGKGGCGPYYVSQFMREQSQTRIEASLQPEIKIKPPGPDARSIIARDEKFASTSYIKEYPLVVERGEGPWIYDVDGNRFLDFMAGIAVASTGYSHPKVVRAIQTSAEKFLHICATDFYYESFAAVCEKLASYLPEMGQKRVFLTNSGTEAVEGAIKLARYHTKRQNLIAFQGAFHGRTLGAVSLTSSKVKQRAHFGPLVPGVIHVPYPNTFRNIDIPDFEGDLFLRHIDPLEIAAIFVEPILGEGGYIVPPKTFLQKLREICDQHGILLVFDEIQCGIGRTGQMFASEYFGVAPDILLSAKGLASGMPLGAIIAKNSVMTWPRGSHGSTFGGNPVCCAAALATLEIVEDLLPAIRKNGETLLNGLRILQSKYPRIGDVRGTGFMIGVEFVEPGTQTPATEWVGKLEQLAFSKGLLLLSCGQSTIRLAPPLIVTEHEIGICLDLLQACLETLG